jgi:hypothetical protein
MASYPHPQQSHPYQAPPPKSNGGRCCLFGCLGCFGVFVLAMIVGGILVYFFGRIWVANFAKMGMVEVIKESGLPAEEQEALIEQAEAIADGFRDGDITVEQLGDIMKEIGEGSLPGLFALEAFKNGDIPRSGLALAEKDAATRIVERMQRGISERRIQESEALKPLQSLWEQDTVSDEDIRQLVERWKIIVDTQKLPDEPFDVDFGKEVERAVQRAKKGDLD